MTSGAGEKKIPQGRLSRLTRLSTLGAGLATDLAGAAGRLALGASKDQAARKFHQQAARTLAQTLGGMKGLPMKAGQLLSYMDDLIPPDFRNIYRNTLAQLQTKMRPLRWKEIEEIIEKDFQKKPSELFARFDKEPLAAASIGQVYRAELAGGRPVAVKVQYPGIAEAIRSDLKNIELLNLALSLVLPKVEVERTMGDLTARVLEECDYGCELNNQEEFAKIWEGDPEVVIPRIVADRSSDHVLTSEFAQGKSWQEMLVSATAEEKTQYGRVIYRFVFRSLYALGMFNADPHPGNYLFLPGGRVAFLDFGCVQRYHPETVEGLRQVRRTLMGGAGPKAVREQTIEALGLPPDLDREELAYLDDYTECVYEPVAKDQVFRFDRAYTERLADLSLQGGFLIARKALRKGIREAKRPGFLFLNRIQYGLTSVLAALEAEANWHQMMRKIDEEGASA